jgi:hypothetical protein
MGISRATVLKEQSQKNREGEEFRRYLGVNPAEADQYEHDFVKENEDLDAKRKQLYGYLADPAMEVTHAQFDDEMHTITNQQQANTRKAEIKRHYTDVAEEWARPEIQEKLEQIWTGQGSERPADVPRELGIDVEQLTKAYWEPVGINPLDERVFKRAQRNVLNDAAFANDMDPDALEDEMKWRAQNLDLATGGVLEMPKLADVTSGKLSEIATGFLNAAQLRDKDGRLVPNELIRDPDDRADAQRAYLKEQAVALGVDPDDLHTRVNLRLSRPTQNTPIEKSYSDARQAFFASKDDEDFPLFRNADGSPMGDREKWKKWNLEIRAMGRDKARYTDEYGERVVALERGENAREMFLLDHPRNRDFERWYGTGRFMTEQGWQDYIRGRLIGYSDLDLDKDLKPPANETLNRDRIQSLYRASDRDQRLDTTVRVWIAGRGEEMSLAAAYGYVRKFMKNTSGRTLETMAAHDDPNPKGEPSTVGAANGP